MARVDPVDRYLCLSVDVQGYGANDDVRQGEIQAELVDLLDTAGGVAGLTRGRWIRQAKGDEELSLIPAIEPQQRVVGDFCLELAAQLRRRNDDRDPSRRLRLRLAMDEGPVEPASNGFAGRPVVGVSRLVNARPVRQALALADDADLAVIVSHGVYRDFVHSGRSAARPDWFRRVSVVEKEFAEDAWLWVPGADVHGLALTPAVPPAAPSPAGLPWPGAHFTGRESERARVVDALRQDGATPAICAISGMPGVGKTTLAIHAAREVVADYADGCVFVDLHGYTAQSTPDDPAEVLDRMLRRLGVPGDRIPRHVDDRTALLRECLEGRRVLFVLDNAHDLAQVRPLLPNVPGCGTLITSRVRLTALDEATLVPLDVLSDSESAALFRSVVGSLADEAPPELVRRIVVACGRLPLAIRIVAARYRSDATLGLAALSARLDDEHARLAELDDGDRSVAASLAVSRASLPPAQQSLFSLLAVHPATEFRVPAAAAVAGVPVAEARASLDGLVGRHLLSRPAADRYRFHDLVGVFARGDARAHTTATERAAARRRMVDFYLAVAERADLAITPHRYRIPIAIEHPPAAAPDVSRPDDALAWLAAEERALVELCRVAGDQGLDVQCWQLSHVLRGYFFLTKRWQPWEATHAAALAAARRLGDERAEALTLNNVGLAAIEQRRLAAAAELYRAALVLFERVGDEQGMFTARTNLAWTAFYQGRYDEFLRDMRRSLAFHTRTGSAGNAAITLRGIALGEIEVGEIAGAIEHLREALAVFERLDLDLDLAMTLNAMGEAYARSHDAATAADHHRRALEVARRCGSEFEQARAHHRLGELAAAAGDADGARERWEQAYAGYRALGAHEAAEVRDRLASWPP